MGRIGESIDGLIEATGRDLGQVSREDRDEVTRALSNVYVDDILDTPAADVKESESRETTQKRVQYTGRRTPGTENTIKSTNTGASSNPSPGPGGINPVIKKIQTTQVKDMRDIGKPKPSYPVAK